MAGRAVKGMRKAIAVIGVILLIFFSFCLSGCKRESDPPHFEERFEIPEFTRGKWEGSFNSSGTTEVKRYAATTQRDFEEYKDTLILSGFSLYDENQIENNFFATLTKEEVSVHLSWFGNAKVMRIIAEEKGEMCPLTETCQAQVTPLLTGYKDQTVVAAEGMGYIVRLSDGSFCIIDGGMGDPNHVDSDNIMRILREQSPAGVEKPVVAAWIFTHLHGDHVGAFNCFSLDHHDEVIIERLVYNFPKEEEIAVSDSVYMLDDSIYRWNQFKKNLSDFYSDVPVLKVHTGDRFQVRDAHFEVLYTLEEMYPQTIADGWGLNESSLLLKMSFAGQTFLWTGDFGSIAESIVMSAYSARTLSCDFLQMAHHGMNGSVRMYAAVDPEYALLPIWYGLDESGSSSIDFALSYEQNAWLARSEKMKQMIVTACGTWTIALPYAPDPDKIMRIPSIDTIYPSYPALLGR